MGNECPKCQTENPPESKFCMECATPLEADVVHTKTLETPTEELTRGTVFAGRYEIIEELGKGGMGRVYRVEDTNIKEEIALKLIKPEVATDKKMIERFRNELKLARDIAHRNVCRMYDLGEEKGQHYITMEYVSGGDLKTFIRRAAPLSSARTISIAKQICEGLAEAHSLGVVHRDLKPSNIMIDDNGNARIMDFGIARSIKSKGITGSGVMIGTPEYMSPEQAEAKEIDRRSDIYSLGVILYEMTTGRLPFEGDTPLAVAMKHKGESPKNPKEFNPQIPENLSGVILKCLEKDKNNRYQGAEDVRSELEKIEQGLPTTDRVVPKKTTFTSKEITVQFRLKKMFIPAFAVFAIAIIGLFLWHPWSRTETPPVQIDKLSVAVLPFEDDSPQKDLGPLCNGIADSVISALSNIKVLRVPARGSPSLYKKGERDYKEISKLLNVNFVLDGTLQKSGDTLRIIPRLYNVAEDLILWSEPFNKEIQDIFIIQDDITKAIVDKLKVNLLAEEKDKVYKRGTESVEAYNQYILGKFHMAKRNGEDYIKAYDYFNKAVELDPNYALAYVGLADTYILHSFVGALPAEVRPKAAEAVAKALAIDENLGEARTSLAWIKFEHNWDWEGAEKEFKRAIELNPNYATAHQWYAEYLNNMGRLDEAKQEIEKALELSPLSLVINTMVGFIDFYAKRYDKAILQYKKTIAMDPNFQMTYMYLNQAYFYNGMYKELLEEAEKWAENGIIPEETLNNFRMQCEFRMGRKEEFTQYFEKMKSVVPNMNKAIIYFVFGDVDQGFLFLEKAYEERYSELRFIKIEPEFDNIRSDPRYKEILRKMNLEE